MGKDLYTKSLTPSSSLVELNWMCFDRFNTIFHIIQSNLLFCKIEEVKNVYSRSV